MSALGQEHSIVKCWLVMIVRSCSSHPPPKQLPGMSRVDLQIVPCVACLPGPFFVIHPLREAQKA